jgi:6-phosphogluconolactonase
MDMTVVEDPAALARSAAELLVAALAGRSDKWAVCLAGGSTPQGLYRLLATDEYRARLPWRHVHWFLSDERLVLADDARSNIRMIREALLDHVPAPRENVHAIPTSHRTPQACAEAYDAELRAFHAGRAAAGERTLFDITFLGVGTDGHTASLFPGSTSLGETRRWAAVAGESGTAPFVPRVTLTTSALALSKQVVFLVAGAEKRAVLARIREGDDLPATRVARDGNALWIVDRVAAG